MIRKSCLRCGRPGPVLCAACGAKEEARRERPSRQARGYTAEYVRNRNAIVRSVLADPANARCVLCGRGFTGCAPHEITAEHIVPLRLGGTSSKENLAAAHSWCNYGWNR